MKMSIPLLLIAFVSTAGQDMALPETSIDRIMSRALVDTMARHVLLTPPRPVTPQAIERAEEIVVQVRSAIRPFQDTMDAVAAGYRLFPRYSGQHIYHYSNIAYAAAALREFDIRRPPSLLYKKDNDGTLVLIGAMYIAAETATLDELEERIPLSIARWHRHVNWCVPKNGEQARWMELRRGRPLFGPDSEIATASECEAIGGRFLAAFDPWMVHAHVFEGNDLAAIWGEHGPGQTHRH